MGSFITRLRIRSLRAKIEASRLRSAELAEKFQSARTGGEKTRIARRYDEALKHTHTLQLLLSLLERQERDAGGEPADAESHS